jgi:integrase
MIALSPSNAIVLREYREAQNKQRLKLDQPEMTDYDLVFCQQDGKPYKPDTVGHYWIKLAKRTGLEGVRLHDAQHTHASWPLRQGVHPKIVQERLGHASIETTLDTYSHVAPGLKQAAANSFDEMILGKTKQVNIAV